MLRSFNKIGYSALSTFSRRKFATEATNVSATEKSAQTSPETVGVIVATVLAVGTAAIAAVRADLRSTEARATSEKIATELKEYKKYQDEVLEKAKKEQVAMVEKFIQAEKEVLKAQADSVKDKADSTEKSLKAQVDSVKAQTWWSAFGPYAAAAGVGAVTLLVANKGK